mgnify:CR=1 FL=1
MNLTLILISTTMKTAPTNGKRSRWCQALRKEFDACERLKEYNIRPKTKATLAVPTEWLLVTRNDGTFKARVLLFDHIELEIFHF